MLDDKKLHLKKKKTEEVAFNPQREKKKKLCLEEINNNLL